MSFKLFLSLIIIIVIPGCFNTKKKKLTIPAHSYYIPRKIQWEKTEFDNLKGISKQEDASLIILTGKRIIIIEGQFGLTQKDSILMPWTGEYGINYEVLNNESAELSDNTIHFGQAVFIKSDKVNFQWWDEIAGKIGKTGKGTIIVSGP